MYNIFSLNIFVENIMVIKDHKRIALVGGDTLISTPFIGKSKAMTLMYMPF
jgi:hypothetical protein